MGYDVVFVCDTTASMGFFLDGIRKSLEQFMLISRLTGIINRFAVLGYKDYSDNPVLQWSDWRDDPQDLFPFVESTLRPVGGHDQPEAAKTAIHHLHGTLNKNGTTIVFWYTDAGPHNEFSNRVCKSLPSHIRKEKEALGVNFDWFTVLSGLPENCFVFPIVRPSSPLAYPYWIHAAETTKGICLVSSSDSGDTIAFNTVSLFLNMMEEECPFDENIHRVTSPNVLAARCEADLCKVGEVKIERKFAMPHVLPHTTDVLVERYTRDAKYRTQVFDVFEALLHPSNVIALTFNPVFGKLWRAICRSRDDFRRDRLVAKLGTTIDSLPNDAKTKMKAFIELTYNQRDEIARLRGSVNDPRPAIVYDGKKRFSAQQILELSRSCNDKILAEMMEIIVGLAVAKTGGELPEEYIPKALGSEDILAMVPSLVTDGVMFGKRPSLILAMLAKKCKSVVLEDVADDFIKNVRGKWLDKESPENYSMGFVKLVLSCPDVLTKAEAEWFTHLQLIGGLQINELTNLTVVTGYSSKKTKRPDEKVECTSCRSSRSFTLMTSEGTCVFCAINEPESPIEPFPNEQASYFCECEACKVHYAVARIELLNVRPKCHFCRNGQTAPSIECHVCRNKYLYQCGPSTKVNDWECPTCRLSDPVPRDYHDSSFHRLVDENNLGLLGFDLTDAERFWTCRSVYKAKDMLRKDDQTVSLTFTKKQVLNVEEIRCKMLEWIKSGDAEFATCNICFEDLRKDRVLLTCANKNCGVTACETCLGRHYAESKPGNVVFPSNLTCPYCKRHPGLKILQKHNPEICQLKRFDLESFDRRWYYAWCVGCYSLKQCVEKVCSETAPNMTQWRCDGCVVHTNLAVKACPECGVMTEKVSGCDHITCTNCEAMNGEATHWCFACNGKFDYNSIYAHMSRAHGGYGIDYDDDEDDMY